jgi:hypothetical protein
MIPDVILDVNLHVILHGFGALSRVSIRPCEQVVGTEPIMSKQRPRSLLVSRGILRWAPSLSRMTRYIVCKQAVNTAIGTNRHVPAILRLP